MIRSLITIMGILAKFFDTLPRRRTPIRFPADRTASARQRGAVPILIYRRRGPVPLRQIAKICRETAIKTARAATSTPWPYRWHVMALHPNLFAVGVAERQLTAARGRAQNQPARWRQFAPARFALAPAKEPDLLPRSAPAS